MNEGHTQSEEVLERTNHVPDPQSKEGYEYEPRVPFRSDLLLTREQEENLIEHAQTRLDTIESEMGRSTVKNTNWWTDAENVKQGSKSWMGKREMYEAVYQNDVSWRPTVLGGIFAKTNLVVPIARRITRQMVARANSYFFATDPWFSAKAERGVGNHQLAEKIDQYAKFKLNVSGSKSHKEKAVELGFVRGETVMKSVYRKKEDFYHTTVKVLVGVDGEPILDTSGGYIFENDRWGPKVLIDEQTGEETLMEGTLVLERDPEIDQPSQLLWLPKRIKQSITLFAGAESEPVYFKDFLCPLTAKSVEDADICAHIYDMQFMDLAETYRAREVLTDMENEGGKDNEQWEATIRAVDLLRELANNDGAPKAAKDQQEDDSDEQRGHEQDPVMEVAECYLHYDADGDGIREHIMLVYDRLSGLPIFYDYVANITPDGLRPFTVIRPTDVDGRWYGVGSMEMFESTQEIVDLLINRWSFSQSKAGRVTLWDPSKTIEGDRNPHLKLNDGATYTKKPNVKTEDILDYVTLPDIKHEAIKDMFEFFLQIAMNESGVQHANDANMAGMDQAKLATGIRNIEKSGMEMFAAYLSKLEPGIQATLNKEVNLIFANLDKSEVFEYFDRGKGGEESAIILNIDPDEVRDLVMQVSVLMTRYRGEQVVQQATAAKDAVIEFYGLLPEVQERTAPFFQMFIKALDLSVDADLIIQPMPLMGAPSNGADPGQAAAATQSMPTGKPTPNL